jgi:hypothetical protein
MASFGKMFGGTMGVLFAIGLVCLLGIGGCLFVCGGVASLPMMAPAVKQAREAAEKAREKREAEERGEVVIAPTQDVEVKPEETPETE